VPLGVLAKFDQQQLAHRRKLGDVPELIEQRLRMIAFEPAAGARVMPQEVLVSSSLKVGQTLEGTIKHFIGRREHRTPAPITLLSETQLRIGDNDVRQVICAVTESGQTSYLVNSGTAAAEAAWLAEAQLNRASALLQEVTAILRPRAIARGDGDNDVIPSLQYLFDFVASERERNRPNRRFASGQPTMEAIHGIQHR
jgi:hypothetical protein